MVSNQRRVRNAEGILTSDKCIIVMFKGLSLLLSSIRFIVTIPGEFANELNYR